MLSACGGGGGASSADASTFSEKIGLSPSPAPTPSPSPSPAPAPAPAPASFTNAKWVDFQNGNDNNDGLTKATAWKHSPGDPNATGTAAAYQPKPGDQIVFAAGSRYFGSIKAQFAGAPGNPIKLIGENPAVPSFIDGSESTATAQACPSATACAGIAAWRQASIAVFDSPLPAGASFSAGGQLLTPAQWPDPSDLFYAAEISEMKDVAGAEIAAGAITLPAELSRLSSADGITLALWVNPNVVVERPATGLRGGKILFDSTGLQPYTDRPDKFAVRGLPSMISMAGEFAIMPDRKTVLFVSQQPAANISVAAGRSGIDLSGANDVVVANLSFENFADKANNIRSGLPIWVHRSPAANITIENNSFRNLFMVNGGQGPMMIQRVAGLTIRGNTISTVADGSGMRLVNNTNVVVERNVIERVGRTAIYLADNSNSLVLRNRIRDVYGVHGNGISIYLGNQHTQVIANTVTEAYRPMTIRGANDATPAFEDALIANNLFVTGEDSLGSFTAFGGKGKNIRLVNNVILGSRKGSLRFSAENSNVRIERNVIDGFTFDGQYPADWVVQNNAYRILGVFQNQYHPSALAADLAPEFTAKGLAPTNLTQFCRYISEPLDLVFGTRYDRNVGADFVCP
jgi:hypothetical protein